MKWEDNKNGNDNERMLCTVKEFNNSGCSNHGWFIANISFGKKACQVQWRQQIHSNCDVCSMIFLVDSVRGVGRTGRNDDHQLRNAC